jgi:tetratricopeptide (TPR) repeat protein
MQQFRNPRVSGLGVSLAMASLLCFHSGAQTVHSSRKNMLIAQQTAQQVAIASGDTDRVAQTSQILIAGCLRELARLRLLAGDGSEAVAMERQALDLDNSNAGRLDLAHALVSVGDSTEAQRLVGDVLASNPHDPAALRLKAELTRRSPPHRPTAPKTLADRNWERHLRRTLAVAYNDWGTTQAQQRDYRGAFGLFTEGEYWDPTVPGLMHNLGMAAFELGDFDRSANAFTAALGATTAQRDVAETKRVEVLLGLSQFLQRHYNEASKAFAAAQEATYADAHATYAWAFSLAHLNEPRQTSSVLARLVQMPIAPQDRAMACQVYDQIEAYEQSVSCFRRVLQEDGTVPRVHFELGAALIHLNQPAEALPELSAELAQGDKQPEVTYYLSYALNETQQKDKAEHLLLGLVEEQPNYTEAQYLLGKILLEKGDVKGAIQHLEQAALTTPDEPFIHYQLQSAYRQDGRAADAAREMRIYSDLKAKTRNAPAAR